VAILLRTEIERKGCTGAFMALVSLSSRPIWGPQTAPLAPVFSHLLGGQQLHWRPVLDLVSNLFSAQALKLFFSDSQERLNLLPLVSSKNSAA